MHLDDTQIVLDLGFNARDKSLSPYYERIVDHKIKGILASVIDEISRSRPIADDFRSGLVGLLDTSLIRVEDPNFDLFATIGIGSDKGLEDVPETVVGLTAGIYYGFCETAVAGSKAAVYGIKWVMDQIDRRLPGYKESEHKLVKLDETPYSGVDSSLDSIFGRVFDTSSSHIIHPNFLTVGEVKKMADILDAKTSEMVEVLEPYVVNLKLKADEENVRKKLRSEADLNQNRYNGIDREDSHANLYHQAMNCYLNALRENKKKTAGFRSFLSDEKGSLVDLIEQDKSVFLEVAELVSSVAKDYSDRGEDSEDVCAFVKDIGHALANLTQDQRVLYLLKLNNTRNLEGVESALDYAHDFQYAFLDLGGNLENSFVYSEIAKDKEKKSVHSRRNFGMGVGIGMTDFDMNLDEAITFGDALDVFENPEYRNANGENVRKASDILVGKSGLELPDNFGDDFSRIYARSIQSFSLRDATSTFVPAYFYTINRAARKGMDLEDTRNLLSLETHVRPSVEFFENNPKYKKDFVKVIGFALDAAASGAMNNPQESWKFAGYTIDSINKGYNVPRWGGNVLGYAEAGLSLDQSRRLVDAIEEVDKQTGFYGDELVMTSLKLQSATGVSKEDMVSNAIESLKRGASKSAERSFDASVTVLQPVNNTQLA
ncbi:hypothetical protein J4216_00145 [Candidatus Woesearchaeota archaeon]|nr:hypothetical protein [Candidatus Woesearchaeota archaeon]